MNEQQRKRLLSSVDHTNLNVTASYQDIITTCEEAILYQTASVCIPPSFVGEAVSYVDGQIPICTVIGFPNGYMSPLAKEYETKQAVLDGAKEIDMVIAIGRLKEGKDQYVSEEIRRIRQACSNQILKVIIETCLLTNDEKKRMCEIVTKEEADFIKTSTGLSTGGATQEDIILFKNEIGSKVKIKAAGGIHSIQDGLKFLELGASRLGTSRIVSLLKKEDGLA